jgi:tetratricopeptide (TPR) repeat protein
VAAASKPVVVAEAQAAPAPAVVHAPAPTKPEATKPAAAPAAAAPIAEDEGGSAADNLVSRARKLLSSDDAAGAEALARKALGLDSTDHHAMEVLARALMDQDRGAEALPYARKIVKVRRNRVPYWLLYGDLLLMTGDEAGAKTQWNIALQLSPGDREVKHRLGL